MAEDFKPLLKPFEEEPDESPTVSRGQVLSAVPGFWGRAGAFLIDGVLLTFIFYMAANYAYESLYPYRMACQAAAIALVYVYFWIGSSALTRGQTMGKFVFGYRVVALDRGGPPTLGQAALRAALVQAIVLACVFIRFPIHTTDPTYSFIAAFTLVRCLASAYAVSNAVFCGLHPQKLSFHDLLTRTAVVRSTEEARAVEFYGEWDETSRTKLKLAGYPTITICVLVLFFLGYGYIGNHDQIVKNIEDLETVRRNLDVPGFHLLALVGPSPEDRKQFEDILKQGMDQLEGKSPPNKDQTRSGDSNRDRTPAPMSAAEKKELARKIEEFRKFGRDGRKFIFYFDCDDSLSTLSLTADPRYLALLARLPRVAEILSAESYLDEKGEPLPYGSIQAVFNEILPLYLHVEAKFVHREVLPLEKQATPNP